MAPLEILTKQVARARRRLAAQRFLLALIWCWFAALLVATAALLAPKIWPLRVDPWAWSAGWLAGSLLGGLLAAVVWTYVSRRNSLDAAIEIDRRFSLKERVSSALSLDAEERESEAGQAVIADAGRRVGRLDIDDKFRVSLSRRAWLPLAPAAAAFAVIVFVPDRQQETAADDVAAQQAIAKQIHTAVEPLQKKLAEQQKQAEEQGLKNAADFFRKIEEGVRELERPDIDRKQAMVKLNDLAKQVAERREQLGGDRRLEEQLSHLKNAAAGPADKLAKAMKNGDFKQAMQQIDELQRQLRDPNTTAEQKQQLAQQLKDMQQRLEQMAAAHQEAQQKLKQQIAQMQKAGQTEQARKLQDQLDKLERQSSQVDKLSDLASKLGQAANDIAQGKPGDASQSLEQLKSELSQLQQAEDEIEMLDAASDQLAQMKTAMNCDKCQGGGCEACQGGGGGEEMGLGGALGQGEGDPNGRPGMGLGEGRGQGARPEEKTATSTRDTQVRQKVGAGGAVVTGETGGPNVKGDVQQRIQDTVEAGRRRGEDPLNRQALPRNQREHVQEYFDRLREGAK